MNYFYAATSTILLLFVFIILRKKDKRPADFLLISLNILIGLFFLSDILVRKELSSASIIFQNAIPLLIFPFFINYVIFCTNSENNLARLIWVTFVPFSAIVTLSIIDHYILKNYDTYALIEEHYERPALVYQIIFKGGQLLFIAILVMLLFEIKKYEQGLKSRSSNLEQVEVGWLRNVIIIYLGSIILTFFSFLAQNLGILPIDVTDLFTFLYFVLGLSIFYINFYGIQHYSAKHFLTNSLQNHVKENLKGELSEDDKELEERMLKTIEEKELYLSHRLSLGELAELMNVSTHAISRVINSKENRTFYDLINNYRINHFKELLQNPSNSNYTILALGLDSGFNSKASMNRIFKEIEGITPRQFVNQMSHPNG